MNSVKLLGAALAALVVTGCNSGQPRLWKVSIGQPGPLPASCYIDNMPPQQTVSVTGLTSVAHWVLWDGSLDTMNNQKQLLDIGATSLAAGQAPPITIAGAIEGDAATRLFVASRTENRITPNVLQEAEQATIKIQWESYNAGANGTMNIDGQYQCSGNCPMRRRFASCNVTLNFTARRIDTTQNSEYSTVGCTSGCNARP